MRSEFIELKLPVQLLDLLKEDACQRGITPEQRLNEIMAEHVGRPDLANVPRLTVDRDILIHLAAPMATLLNGNDKFQAWAEAAFATRAWETVRLHADVAKEEPFPFKVLYHEDDPRTHWEATAPISQLAFGAVAFDDPRVHFPACGIGEDGDLEWEVETIDSRPVTCPKCLELLRRAQEDLLHGTVENPPDPVIALARGPVN